MPYKRKADDDRILALNSIGMSLNGIGDRLGVHHTTVRYRLKVLGVEPADTRRSFMEDVYQSLSPEQQEWLISRLGPGYSIKDFVRALLVRDYAHRKREANSLDIQ